MAVKDKPQGVQDSTEQADNTEVAQDTTEVKTAVKTQHSGYNKFIYIGPSIPPGRLKANVVLEGEYSAILEFFTEEIEKYPQIKQLIIPINRLSEFAAKIKTKGNIINKYYHDIVSTIKKSKED